jgi:hypothetical protein
MSADAPVTEPATASGGVPDATPEPTTTPAGDTALSDWRQNFSDADLAAAPSVQKFQNPEALAKSYVELESRIGAKGVVPPKDDSPEEQARFYAELGRPESAEAYELGDFAPPEGLPWDEGFQGRMQQMLWDAGLTSTQVQKVLAGYSADLNDQYVAVQQAHEAQVGQGMESLKREYGEAFPAKIEMARRLFKHAAGDQFEALATTKLADGSNLGDNPGLIRMLAKIGGMTGEHDLSGIMGEKRQQFSFSPAEAEGEINRLLGDKDFMEAYMSAQHPEHRAAVEKMDGLHKAAASQGEEEGP